MTAVAFVARYAPSMGSPLALPVATFNELYRGLIEVEKAVRRE